MKKGLNENIKCLRINHGMNQVELAKKLGVTKQCISNWENDNIFPSIDMLIKIANFFKVSTDMLLGLNTENTISADGLTERQSAHIRMLVRDFCDANKTTES